ncbi:uncharacterized protein Dsimw501_GD28177 [Drosophila simulans]|uniref:Uncharacterized protein n=1 Tax=Drosophila simulans TaxID=7240 RepID=A0A0J9QTS5_DROSI|nr:uncharacterized protein Dsimw501_GD28177 [Drosophila simulans]
MACNRKMIAAKHIICIINELQAADCTPGKYAAYILFLSPLDSFTTAERK